MELNEYQDKTQQNRQRSEHGYWALFQISAKAGALHNLYANNWANGKTSTHDDQIRELLGELLYTISCMAADYQFTLEEIAESEILGHPTSEREDLSQAEPVAQPN